MLASSEIMKTILMSYVDVVFITSFKLIYVGLACQRKLDDECENMITHVMLVHPQPGNFS